MKLTVNKVFLTFLNVFLISNISISQTMPAPYTNGYPTSFSLINAMDLSSGSCRVTQVYLNTRCVDPNYDFLEGWTNPCLDGYCWLDSDQDQYNTVLNSDIFIGVNYCLIIKLFCNQANFEAQLVPFVQHGLRVGVLHKVWYLKLIPLYANVKIP